MAPAHHHPKENSNPQQQQQQRRQPYSAFTRKAASGGGGNSSRRTNRPSAVATDIPPHHAHRPTAGQRPTARKQTGIERSYESLSRVLPSPRVAGVAAHAVSGAVGGLLSPSSGSGRSVNSYSSFTRHGAASAAASTTTGGASRGASMSGSVTSAGTSAGRSTATGGSGSTSASVTSRGTVRASKTTTGIERSYDSVTQTLKSVGSYVGGGSRGGNNDGNTSRGGRGSGGSIGSSKQMAPPAPVASMDSYQADNDESTYQGTAEASTATYQRPTQGVAAAFQGITTPPPAATTSESTVASTQIGQHLISASASMSYDDYERMRMESRVLKQRHEQMYGGEIDGGVNMGVGIADGGINEGEEFKYAGVNSKGVTNSGNEFTHSTSTALIANYNNNTHLKSKKEHNPNRNSCGMYSARLGEDAQHSRHSLGKGVKATKDATKGMVKMTTEGFTKIRDILHRTSSNDDEMSFFCSDGDRVTKQKVSLDGEMNEGRGAAAGDKRASARALPQSPNAPSAANGNAKQLLRNNIAPKLEAATKTALQATREGVEYTARNMVKVTQQGVEGVGMIVSDLASDIANAKTPAKSNVTRKNDDYHMMQMFNSQQDDKAAGVRGELLSDGRYADYVHDPSYQVVLTPPPTSGGQGQFNANNAGKTPYGCDPQTPACLVGAVTAGRCVLPTSHPDSLEFLPEGIPRVLVVHDDWEERAGFVPAFDPAVAAAGTGSSAGGAVSAGDGANVKYAVELNPRVTQGDRRISNPIDIDEETATLNGEEIDKDEMLALREGRATPTSLAGKEKGFDYDHVVAGSVEAGGDAPQKDGNVVEVNSASEEGEEEVGSDDNENDPRNASMWVAVPDNYMEEDAPDNYLEKSMYHHHGVDGVENGEEDDSDDEEECVNVGDVHIDLGEDANGVDGEFAAKQDDKTEDDLITPASVGSDTFFVGDVQIGFEGTPEKDGDSTVVVEDVTSPRELESIVEDEEAIKVEDASVSEEDGEEEDEEDASKALVEDAKSHASWSPTSSKESVEHLITASGVLEAPVATHPTKIEELDVYQRGTHPQAPAVSHAPSEEDSLTSLAKATTAAVVHDHDVQQLQQHRHMIKKKEFETPYSVKKGNRPLTFSEFKTMNKQVLFDLDAADAGQNQGAVGAQQPPTLGANHAHQLYLNPSSESTELSHEPPVRMISGQQLYLNPSESTDLSQYSNWAAPAAVKREEAGTSGEDPKSDSRRQLKGRIILVRIKKKISKVAKKMLFIKSKKKDDELVKDGNSFVIALPEPADPMVPISPHSVSVASVTSSIMTGNGCIGVGRVENGSPTAAQQFLYGTINYGNRSSAEDSTVDGSVALPPPPSSMPLPPKANTEEDEDAVSYLAEAMRHASQENDGGEEEGDEEDSVLLLVTPKDDGSGEEIQVISAVDGTPIQVRDIIDAAVASGASNSEDDEHAPSEVKPNNLACLFTDEKQRGGTPIQIMDAMEVDGNIVLTPQNVNRNVNQIFRKSTGSSVVNLLPGSVIDSDEEEEDESLLYHDGCTIIRQSSTFGDNTVATMTTAPKQEVDIAPSDDMRNVVGTPILSPDGPPLTREAAANGSFLFSPNNMGRAEPSTRAKERASLKGGKTKPSITLLPPAVAVKTSQKSTNQMEGDDADALAIRQSYSYSTLGTAATKENIVEMEEGAKAKETEDFSFQTLMNKFSTDDGDLKPVKKAETLIAATPTTDVVAQGEVESPPETPIKEDEMNTPVVTNVAETKKYPKTPFPEAGIKAGPSRDSSPLLVTLNIANTTSPMSTASVSSFEKSATGGNSGARKKSPSPKYKNVPKSALRTRKGFVKNRVSDIQQRIEVQVVTTTTVDGRLKRNHSYRLKNTRRMTNGNGCLAPNQSVLQPTYVGRSVAIGIPKSCSRDSVGQSFSYEEDAKHSSSKEDKEEQDVVDDENESLLYASKYAVEAKQHEPSIETKESSPDSARGSISDASETTECDPFTSLLGKYEESEDEESDEDEDDLDKENGVDVASTEAPTLPFKSNSRMLVKPTEINQHEKREPLSPVPMPARGWRQMAAKAAADKEGQSSRFRSEKSWREISGI